MHLCWWKAILLLFVCLFFFCAHFLPLQSSSRSKSDLVERFQYSRTLISKYLLRALLQAAWYVVAGARIQFLPSPACFLTTKSFFASWLAKMNEAHHPLDVISHFFSRLLQKPGCCDYTRKIVCSGLRSLVNRTVLLCKIANKSEYRIFYLVKENLKISFTYLTKQLQ